VVEASNGSRAKTSPRADPKRELGRGERVFPGIFRLRLPLPWPGVPHCNAWAVRAGEGFVLFDTGMRQPDSIANLERALEMCGLRLEEASLIVCTHAHSDHCGQRADHRRARRLRDLDAPKPRAAEEHGRGPRRRVRTAPRGGSPERRSG